MSANKNLDFIIAITNYYGKMKAGALDLYNLDNKIIRRGIQNSQPTPWLDWIASGIKTYEGRLNRGVWTKIKPDDIVIWTDGKKEVRTLVTLLKYYPDFGLAFKDLGQKLLPIRDMTVDKAKNLYSDFYSDEDIKKYGTIAIGLKVLPTTNSATL